mgnify:CR=1 FL=1
MSTLATILPAAVKHADHGPVVRTSRCPYTAQDGMKLVHSGDSDLIAARHSRVTLSLSRGPCPRRRGNWSDVVTGTSSSVDTHRASKTTDNLQAILDEARRELSSTEGRLAQLLERAT